jgi:RHS repeat-associated protein
LGAAARENRQSSYYRARYYDTNVGRFVSEDPKGLKDNPNLYVYVRNGSTNSTDPFGLYQLRGFPAAAEVLMNFGIKEALQRLRASCCAGRGTGKLADAVQNATYVYLPDLNTKYCGNTGPLTFLRLRHEIGIGWNAFTPQLCGDLSCTIIHEAAHSRTHFEGAALGIEEKCAGCKRQ